MTTIIKIEETIRDYVESLDYEFSARRDIIAFMIENNMNINSEAFGQYQKEMMEFKVKFSTAKKELEERYVLPILKDNQKAQWMLDYQTCELIITEQE